MKVVCVLSPSSSHNSYFSSLSVVEEGLNGGVAWLLFSVHSHTKGTFTGLMPYFLWCDLLELTAVWVGLYLL